jgi:GH25 family lysozyme M1 (1,4-beta-N-acetylmuramidase)
MIPDAHGPDWSHHQTLTGSPIPAWPLWTHKATEGANYVDPMFLPRWRDAEARGHRWRGGYTWLRSDATMKVHADNALKMTAKIGGLPVGTMWQTDWETTPNLPPVTAVQVTEFNDRIEQGIGRQCVITYGSDWVPEFIQWRMANPDAPLWYANYNTNPELSTGGPAECAKYSADVWQWTSSFTHPCVAGRFDMNAVLHAATLDRVCGLETTPAPAPPTPGDDMALNYYNVTGANAKFIGTAPLVRWTGPGDARVETGIKTQLDAGNLIRLDLTGGPSAFAATILDGDLPTGDTAYTWTGDEFANAAEIKARLAAPTSNIDQVARDAAAAAASNAGQASVAAADLSAAVDKIKAGLRASGT